MTTPEDRLAALLRAEEATVSGDGLARISRRVATRRRNRLLVLPGAGLVTAAAVTAFFVLTAGSGGSSLTQVPPVQDPTPTVTAASDPFDTAIWPFTSQSQADAWKLDHGAMPWAGDPVQVAQHFLTDYLGIDDLVATEPEGPPPGSTGKLALQPTSGGHDVGVLLYTGDGPYSVTGAGGSVTFGISDPTAGTQISSPLTVHGTITGVDEQISLRLLSAAGKELGTGSTPAGTGPWSASVPWADDSWAQAALVAVTHSARDGATNRLAVVSIGGHRDPHGTGPLATFVGIEKGHVSLFTAAGGTKVRQLTFPAAGFTDTAAAWNGSTLLWTRRPTSGCGDALYRLVDGQASPVDTGASDRLTAPRLSPDGKTLGFATQPCAGDAGASVELRTEGRAGRILVASPTAPVISVDDVRDDGSALLRYGTTNAYHEAVVGPTTVDLGQTELAPAADCDVGPGAFGNEGVVAFEQCPAGVRLVRFSDVGARTGNDAFVDLANDALPNSVSAHDGQLVVWLDGGDSVGALSTYVSGRLVPAIRNGCPSTQMADACVRGAQW